MRISALFLAMLLASLKGFAADPPKPTDIFQNGEAIDLDGVIPANERGILCLVADGNGKIYGGTTGRAAHLFVYDSKKNEVKSLLRLEGGIGFAYAMIRLPDGSLIVGTQADPTGIAVATDPKAVGQLYRVTLNENAQPKVEDLGVPVQGQGIYTLAYLSKSDEIVGNTWPDGHFFTYDLNTKQFKDHGAIAGYRTFETPRHAEEINRGTDLKVKYPRAVSRGIATTATHAMTGGADGFLFRYSSDSKKLEKTTLRLPARAGRESWASILTAQIPPPGSDVNFGFTNAGYCFNLLVSAQPNDDNPGIIVQPRLLPWGYEGPVQGIVDVPWDLYYIAGSTDEIPGASGFQAKSQNYVIGAIPRVNGQTELAHFSSLIRAGTRHLYAGQTDRIARLIRFPLQTAEPRTRTARATKTGDSRPPLAEEAPKLDCHIVFAPEGTTTDGSGYTAIEVGRDGQVYVGAARYGDYAWLLRFDPSQKPLFMDKVVNMRQLTGERLKGINTQAKIHAKIVVGTDGKIWFASKQGHEVFDTRPEYGDPEGYPGGHLCYFDPKTGFSRSLGILKKQEGLQGGVLDEKRQRLYFRTEPKNHFLIYDIASGDVQDRGHIGAACRYMAIDKNGAVYTVGRNHHLCRYDPETNYVEDLKIKVADELGYTPPYVIQLGPNGKLYGAAAGHASLMEFDIDTYKPGLFPEVTMRNVAPAAPQGMPVTDIHAAVFGRDGRLYYPLNTTGPVTKDGKPEAHLRIMRFDPVAKKCETVGVPNIIGLDEEKVKHTYVRPGMDKYKLDHMQGAAVGEDGTLYLMDIYPQLNVACFPRLTEPK